MTFEGTRFTDPAMAHAMANLVMDATPDFYLENIKRCVENGIQPYFALPHIHGLELVERLIRRGYYMGPVNGFFSTGAGGVCGVNPFDLMELVRRTPHGSCFTYQSTFRLTYPISMMMIALGQHTRAGIEENLWDTKKGVRATTLQMIEKQVAMAKLIGRPIATPEQARQMLKIGVTYKTTEETLAKSACRRTARRGTWASWCTRPMGVSIRRRRAAAGTSTPASGRARRCASVRSPA